MYCNAEQTVDRHIGIWRKERENPACCSSLSETLTPFTHVCRRRRDQRSKYPPATCLKPSSEMELSQKCSNQDNGSSNNSIVRVSSQNVYVFEWTVESSSLTSAEFRSIQSPTITTGYESIWQLELERSDTKRNRDGCHQVALHAKLISSELPSTSASFTLAIYQRQQVGIPERGSWLQHKACSVNNIRPSESTWLDTLDLVSVGCYVCEELRLRCQITDESEARIYPELRLRELSPHKHQGQWSVRPGQQTLEYLRSRDLSDVTLVIEGQEVFAHKAVLAAHSPVFRSMFLNQKGNSGKLTLRDIEPQTMRQLVDMMYSDDGQLSVTNCSPEDILSAAKKYQVDWIVDACVTEIRSSLCVDNACKILTLADFYKLDQLKSEALRFIVDNIDRVIETHGFHVMEEARKKLSRDVMFAVAQRMKQLKI